MAKLFLLRHFKSQWNKDDRFAGWVDNPLSDEGRAQAKSISELLANETIDMAYSNALIRCLETVLCIYEKIPEKYPLFLHMDGGKMQEWGNFEGKGQGEIIFHVTQALNERYYGKIQGLNKTKTKAEHGEETVRLWRRGYKNSPPEGESMEEVYNRVVSFFKSSIEKNLQDGKNVLVVASHNSLRVIVKYLEKISDNDIVDLELPFGALITYKYSDGLFEKLQ